MYIQYQYLFAAKEENNQTKFGIKADEPNPPGSSFTGVNAPALTPTRDIACLNAGALRQGD